MSTLENRRADLAVTRRKSSPVHFLSISLLLFVTATSLHGLDPNRRISQYGHTAWRVEDGTITPSVAITQTTDGYIWLAATGQLMRFDGVRFIPWSPPAGQSLPNSGFTYLLGSRDGSLWIGTPGGLSQWKDGQLRSYADPSGLTGVTAIIEDHAGTIWATRYRVPKGEGPLCKVAENKLTCYGNADGIPVTYGLGLTEDSLGNLWFGSNALCRWRPGSVSTYFADEVARLPSGDGVIDVAAGMSGSVWAAIDGVGPKLGVRYYYGGKWSSYVVPGFNGSKIRSHTLFVDRNKSLWIGTEYDGLYHIHGGVADHFGSKDGLSGNSVASIYEDREGNLWVVTEGGVDLFRNTPVLSFSMREGLSAAGVSSILASRDNSIWIGNEGALDILRTDQIPSNSIARSLPGQDVGALFQDHTGLLWLGLDDRLMSYESQRFREVKKLKDDALRGGFGVSAITEDVDYNIWVLSKGKHLIRLANHIIQDDIQLDREIPRAKYLAADRQAGIWIASLSGPIAHYQAGHFQIVPLEHAERPFITNGLFIDSDNSVLVSTAHGVFRWSSGQLTVLDSHNGLPCNAVYSTIKDNHGSLWLYARCGLIRISASEFEKWRKQSDSHLTVSVFDAFDGVQTGLHSTLQPKSSKAPDGRLWFTSGIQVQMIDPDHTYHNDIPPPVHVEELVADRNRYKPQEHLRLPALTRELEIDYTALSFSAPRRVLFRYRLEGHDPDWEQPGTRRQAFYSDLAPGPYRFRVIACNNDGVWNDVGASIDFSIAPAWYQTILFRLVCLIAGLLMMGTLYRWRVRHIARVISTRFDAQLMERTRLARELHDTLLQTIQGSKMVADDALDESTDDARKHQALVRLSGWLGQAVEEGRAALNSLRTSTTQRNDLADGLKRATDECLVQGSMRVSFSVVGAAREMHPIVRDEIYRIGYEAIRNACVHSGGAWLKVNLAYGRGLTMQVSDNGIGMVETIVQEGKPGHFGLQGMRERAARIEAALTIMSSASTGTEIMLVVPESVVFSNPLPTYFESMRDFIRKSGNKSQSD